MPDALSRQFEPDNTPRARTTILPPTCMIGAVTWGIVQAGTGGSAGPSRLPSKPPFHPDHSALAGPAVGALLPSELPPWSVVDCWPPQLAFLVALSGNGHWEINRRLSSVCPEQDLLSASFRIVTSPSRTTAAFVQHLPGLFQRIAHLPEVIQ